MKAKYIFIVLLLNFVSSYGQPLQLMNKDKVGLRMSYLEDKKGAYTIETVLKQPFISLSTTTPNFGLTNSFYWLKLEVINHYADSNLLLKIQNAFINGEIYQITGGSVTGKQHIEETSVINKRPFKTQYVLFSLKIPAEGTGTYFLKVSGNNVLDLPLNIAPQTTILNAISLDQLFFGIYFGIILVMFFYNGFIYLTVKDNNYLYYVFYILTVGITQACLKGYAGKFVWPSNEWLLVQGPNLAIAASGIFSILFVFNFLHLKQYLPKLYMALSGIIAVYGIAIILTVINKDIEAQKLMQVIAGIGAVLIFISGIIVYRKGFKPALYFNISWFFFVTSVIVYILKDAGVLPYNNFTSNVILIGSAIEVTLLSFALADKINTYKKEKEQSQAEALRALRENERLIKEQNIFLEKKVAERTEELEGALSNLKDTQAQLVSAEKMASLGQLTAGIAHEINNPINFVKSNIKPLKLDIQDLVEIINSYGELHNSDISVMPQKLKEIDQLKQQIDVEFVKQELTNLIKGIEEGAERTAEIVRGLRTFSRLDESDIKVANFHDGLDSTLVLLKNNIPKYIDIKKDYRSKGIIECFPGKLNQVFMNVLNNAIHAISGKTEIKSKEFITITTRDIADEHAVEITIADTGTGMSDEVKNKIFEPFFTTKDVGEGTGLGLAIVFKIVEQHNGKIAVNSVEGKGTEFVLTLPLSLASIETS
ncbi:MAG: hypothetical protein JWN76_1378 [Chitinophagaceae bacterium]|nr:hypothetical protein [Chitinophagaceae bacterium]